MFSAGKQPLNTVGRYVLSFQRRHKSKKEHWSDLRRKITPTMKALQHFDDFYRKVFGAQWPSIRIALLSPHKYCAVVNNFGDSDKTITYLQNQGALNFQTFLEIENKLSSGNDHEPVKEKSRKVDNLGAVIQNLALSRREEETSQIYPPSAEGMQMAEQHSSSMSASEEANDKYPKMLKPGGFSLAASRKTAQIDESRNISASLGLSSGALFEFVPSTELKGLEDRVLESDYYSYYSTDTEFSSSVKTELDFHFPSNLNVFMYERGSVMSFESPHRGSTGVLDYYLMDGGSILPVLALGIKPGDEVLDLCAAPGGKSMLMLQTLYTGRLVLNDVQASRVKRIHSVLKQYVYDLPKWKDQIAVTQGDGRLMLEQSMFDKVLVDVPCTTDRHSLHEDDNSIFNAARVKERLRLPELQSELLMNALKLVKPGGTVVYSTCSLSPVQNDGVVHMALRRIWEETKIEVEVRDMSTALEVVKSIFKLGENIGLRYGHLVLPFLPCNFGPLYFCKLVRVK